MRKPVSVIKQLLDECSDEDRGEWKNHTQTILSAVRSSHPTRRGVKSAIASGFFENNAFPALAASGWLLTRGLPHESFTFAMEHGGRRVRVLIASLHQESGKPRRHDSSEYAGHLFIAQLPRKIAAFPAQSGSITERLRAGPEAIDADRSYCFDDFDLLAVNVHGATRRWADFVYTLAAWLRPQDDRSFLISGEQLVPLGSSSRWTSDLSVCVDWLRAC
jgi:hypothetical protein